MLILYIMNFHSLNDMNVDTPDLPPLCMVIAMYVVDETCTTSMYLGQGYPRTYGDSGACPRDQHVEPNQSSGYPLVGMAEIQTGVLNTVIIPVLFGAPGNVCILVDQPVKGRPGVEGC